MSPKTADAKDAVSIEEEHSRSVSSTLRSPLGTQLNPIATIDTKSETTKA